MPGLIAHYGILIVVLIIFAGELGIPTLVPGEIAILIVASQAIHSVPQLIAIWLLFGIVDIIACTTIHTASRIGGSRVLIRLLKCVQPHAECHEEIVASWRRRLGGRDILVVFVTRLIPMFRLYASVTTGLIRIRFRDFVGGAIPASLVWASVPLTIGYVMRSKIRAVEQQYPQLIHYVILGSVSVIVLMAVSWWVRSAGSRAAGLRRLRTAFGLGAVGGALSRLVLVGIYGDGALNRWVPLPSLSAVSLWVTCLSLVALGLLWIAARDLKTIRQYHYSKHAVGVLSTAAWASLMFMFVALNALAGLQHPAVV